MTREYTTRLLDLVDEGATDWETIARAALNWLSENEVQEMCEQSHDISDFFPEEEEEEEQKIDGTQFRYIVTNHRSAEFYGEVYAIEEDGEDSAKPVYIVTETEYNDENFSDVNWLDPEETVDHFLKTVNDLPYADHYLDATDEVVYC